MFMQLTGTDKSGHFIEVSKMSDVSTELSIFFFFKESPVFFTKHKNLAHQCQKSDHNWTTVVYQKEHYI